MVKKGYNYSFGSNRIEIKLRRNLARSIKSLKKGIKGRGSSRARTPDAMKKREKGVERPDTILTNMISKKIQQCWNKNS